MDLAGRRQKAARLGRSLHAGETEPQGSGVSSSSFSVALSRVLSLPFGTVAEALLYVRLAGEGAAFPKLGVPWILVT